MIFPFFGHVRQMSFLTLTLSALTCPPTARPGSSTRPFSPSCTSMRWAFHWAWSKGVARSEMKNKWLDLCHFWYIFIFNFIKTNKCGKKVNNFFFYLFSRNIFIFLCEMCLWWLCCVTSWHTWMLLKENVHLKNETQIDNCLSQT